jgi:hypothetical protein
MRALFLTTLLALSACSDGSTTPTPNDAGTSDAPADVTAPRDGDTATALRDQRYCEVLAGMISGGNVQLDVYNTIGLNDCPDAAWRALDVAALRAELGATVVVLNGPRHWTLDAFESGALQNPTVRTIGGIAMRVAGRIEIPLAVAMGGNTPYRLQTVRRDSTVRFNAGARVYELVAADGAVFVMQSYSLQMQPQTLASLESLGERLRPPTGWSFRTRVLPADLRVTAIDGLATVTTDDLGNTYQRSQQ